MRSFLFLFVMCLTEVAWTTDKADWRDTWETGTHFKLAPEDEFQLMWGPSDTWQTEGKLDEQHERQPGSEKPKLPRRETYYR